MRPSHSTGLRPTAAERQRPVTGKIRVFLVDDHPIVRRGFQMLFSRQPDLLACGEADNGPAALEKILALKPHVAIVDLVLKVGNGLDLIKQLRAQRLNIKLLVFTMRNDALHAERALRAGADGYITKEEGPEKVIEAIRLAMQGRRYVSPEVAAQMVSWITGQDSAAESPAEQLGDRELEILGLIAKGLGSREIAKALHLSIKTVESHREHIKTKLGLTRATELVNYALNWAHSDKPGPS